MVANGLTEKVARDKVRTFPYLLFFYSINPNIKISILIGCLQVFPIEILMRSCFSVNKIHLTGSFP